MHPVNSGQQFVVTLARVIGAHLEDRAPAAGVAAGTTCRGELSSAVPWWVSRRRIPASAGHEGTSTRSAHGAGTVCSAASFAVFPFWPNLCPSGGRLSSNQAVDGPSRVPSPWPLASPTTMAARLLRTRPFWGR